ncbi:GNAT family N-acetyltransferase [Tolypothrix campylonemoides VB511288]|nr:GNAT family N-acetyltransferase [Tolypothrix campylonemoides VB511288]
MLKIRLYDRNDLEEIVQLWYHTWHETFPNIQHPQPYSAWKSRFRDDLAVKGEIWVAEVKYHIVGFVVVIKEEQYLSQIFVNPEYQNCGIGSALLNKAKKICPQGLTLQTLQKNTRACSDLAPIRISLGLVNSSAIKLHHFYWLLLVKQRLQA